MTMSAPALAFDRYSGLHDEDCDARIVAAKAALGRSEEDIKQLACEGRIREFRDGARLMFKADQIEQLKAELGGGGGGGGGVLARELRPPRGAGDVVARGSPNDQTQ